MGINSLIDGSTGWILGWTLVHSLWQAALIAGGLALVLRFLPGAMTRLRAAAAWCALALIVGLAAGTWTLVDTEWRGHAACWDSEAFVRDNPTLCVAHGVPLAHELAGADSRESVMPLSWVRRIALPVPRPVRSASLAVTGGVALLAIVSCLLAMVSLIRLVIGIGLLRRILSQARPMPDPACGAILGRLMDEMGITARVDLRESTEVATPAVAGWHRSTILVPKGMVDNLTPEQLAHVLAHELVHVRGRHYAVNLGQRALDCLCLFNPFAAWISSCIREEREVHCDRVAAGRPAHACRQYAETLLQLEHLRGSSSPALVGLMGEGDLLRRMRRLADASHEHKWPTRRRALLAASVALMTVVCVVHASMTTVGLTSWSVMVHDIELRESTVTTALAPVDVLE